MAKKKIQVNGVEISLLINQKEDYISLTDITKSFPDGKFLVPRWLRNRDTLEFLGTWEVLNNPDFRVTEFDNLYEQSGTNRFSLSISRWLKETDAIGFIAKRGRGANTYAHKDIALGFCYWLSPKFQIYVLKEFQRLKKDEAELLGTEWSIKRVMSKANYKILTEAVKEHLIPPSLKKTKKAGLIYANEADLINLALFGMTSKNWRLKNPNKKGNIRDHATHEQLLVISNLQSLNAKLLKWDCDAEQRLQILNESAIEEMQILLSGSTLKKLDNNDQILLE